MHKSLGVELIEMLACNSIFVLLKIVGVTTFSFRLDKNIISCMIELVLSYSRLCKTCVRNAI